MLAHEMEDYAPMAATPNTMPAPVSAAIISSDLDAGLLQQVMDALGRAGFVDVSSFGDIDQLVTTPPGGKLADWYGKEGAEKVEHAEAFEVCEYGRRPNRAELARLFPFFEE